MIGAHIYAIVRRPIDSICMYSTYVRSTCVWHVYSTESKYVHGNGEAACICRLDE